MIGHSKWYVSVLNTLIFTIVNQMFLKIIATITIGAIVDVCSNNKHNLQLVFSKLRGHNHLEALSNNVMKHVNSIL